MFRGHEKVKTYMSKIGKPEDYIHLPVIKDGKAVGIVVNATEEDERYVLDCLMYVGLELINEKPSAIVIK